MNTQNSRAFNVQNKIKDAIDFAMGGRLEEALLCIDAAIQMDGESSAAHYNRGLILQNMGRLSDAALSYSQCLSLDGANADAALNRGNVYRTMGDLLGALSDYRNACSLRPGFLAAIYLSGLILHDLGDVDAASVEFEKVLAIDSERSDAQFLLGICNQRRARFDDALRNFDRILSSEPEHAGALINSAVIYEGLGNLDAALSRLKLATDFHATEPLAWFLLGNCLHKAGDLEEAASALRQALTIDPLNSEALLKFAEVCLDREKYDEAIHHCDVLLKHSPGNVAAIMRRGNSLQLSGRNAEALAAYCEAAEIDVSCVEAWMNVAGVRSALGDLVGALRGYDRVLAISPSLVPALLGRATVLHALGRDEDALACFREAGRTDPNNLEAQFGLGVLLEKIGLQQEALTAYESVLCIDRNFLSAKINRGVVLNRLGRREEALAAFDEIVSAYPGNSDAHLNRGIVLQEMGERDLSLRSYETAIELNGNLSFAWLNKGVIFHKDRDYSAAFDCYVKAQQCKPDWAEPSYNLGVLAFEKKDYISAESQYKKAIAIEKNHIDANFNLAFVYLITGRFIDGWNYFEWRFKKSSHKEALSFRPNIPVWRGENINGKRLMLLSEQGFGDSIQFCRYVGVLADMGAVVSLVMPERLIRLMASLRGLSFLSNSFVNDEQNCDFVVHLMSVPGLVGTTLKSIPSGKQRYLSVDTTIVKKWTESLPKKVRPRVGLVWRAGSQSEIKGRDLPLLLLQSEISDLDLEYIPLQKDVSEEEKEITNSWHGWIELPSDQEDFADTAGIIENLDLVVSVDTSVAHLSAALGGETWVLLPFNADWRWLESHADSPWYANVRLYRQSSQGDWSAPLKALRSDLLAKFGS